MSKRFARLELRDPRWVAFVTRHPDASFYNHPEWSQLIAECYRYPGFVLALTNDDGTVGAGLPVFEVRSPLGRRRWVSTPFTDYCPLLSSQPEIATALVDELRSAAVPRFEVRAALGEHPGIQARVVGVRHRLTLGSDAEAVRRGFSHMHQKNIRVAQRARVTMRRGSSPTDIDTFYALHLRTRRRQGVPIQPRRFFDMLAALLQRGHGFISTAYWNDIPIASAVFFAWNGVIIEKYAASDERYWSYCPNNMLNWTEIKWACENGFHTFDWGRIGADQLGLRHFKQGWGAVEEPVAYSYIGAAAPVSDTSAIHNALSLIIRRSQPWVCRAFGEIFYRYAA